MAVAVVTYLGAEQLFVAEKARPREVDHAVVLYELSLERIPAYFPVTEGTDPRFRPHPVTTTRRGDAHRSSVCKPLASVRWTRWAAGTRGTFARSVCELRIRCPSSSTIRCAPGESRACVPAVMLSATLATANGCHPPAPW